MNRAGGSELRRTRGSRRAVYEPPASARKSSGLVSQYVPAIVIRARAAVVLPAARHVNLTAEHQQGCDGGPG